MLIWVTSKKKSKNDILIIQSYSHAIKMWSVSVGIAYSIPQFMALLRSMAYYLL